MLYLVIFIFGGWTALVAVFLVGRALVDALWRMLRGL
jgi:hypothetical protein